MTVEIEIWNRACVGSFAPSLPGDVALARAIRFHSLACNGGVAYSLENHADELESVFAAFATLGAPEMREFLNALAQEPSEQARDRLYWQTMNDGRLSDLFKAYFEKNPAAFAPL